MSQAFPTERVFDAAPTGPCASPLSPGLLLLHRGQPASRCCRQGDRLLTNEASSDAAGITDGPSSDDGRHQIHRALPVGQLVYQAVHVVADQHTMAVTLHLGSDPAPSRLALAFAEHLATHRRQHHRNPVAPCITAAAIPDLPDHDRLVRLPHLLTVRHPTGLVDTAVWEVMTRHQATRWLGGPLPRPEPIEAALPQLLTLRQHARAGALPATPEGHRLRMLLAERYLSIRLVYRHPQLFTALLRALDGDTIQPQESHDHPA